MCPTGTKDGENRLENPWRRDLFVYVFCLVFRMRARGWLRPQILSAGTVKQQAAGRYLIHLELRTLLLCTLWPDSLRPQTRRLCRGCRWRALTAVLERCSPLAESSCTAQSQTPTKQRIALRKRNHATYRNNLQRANSGIPGRVRWRYGDTCFPRGRSRRGRPGHSPQCGAVATEPSAPAPR